MEGSQIAMIIGAVIVLGVIIAFVVTRSGAWRERAERAKAAEIREQAAEHDRELREREAAAVMAREKAEAAKAEADRHAEEAAAHDDHASAVRQERDEQLRLADLRDPDVRTDDEGYRIDEDGNRIGDAALGHDEMHDDEHVHTGDHDEHVHTGDHEEHVGTDLRDEHVHDEHRNEDTDLVHTQHDELDGHRHEDTDLDRDGTPDRLEADDVRHEAYDDESAETLSEDERREAAIRGDRREV